MAQILVLEDDATLGPLLKASLEEDGHSVSLHGTASEALAYVAANPTDLIVADILIRDGDRLLPDGGITLISQLKQMQDHPAPVIAISGAFVGLNEHEAKTTAITVGADVTLAKPFEPDRLRTLVAGLLSKG